MGQGKTDRQTNRQNPNKIIWSGELNWSKHTHTLQGMPINSQFHMCSGRVVVICEQKLCNYCTRHQKESLYLIGVGFVLLFVWFMLGIEPKASWMNGTLLKFKTLDYITINFTLPSPASLSVCIWGFVILLLQMIRIFSYILHRNSENTDGDTIYIYNYH